MKTLTLLVLMSLATATMAADKVAFAKDDTPATLLARQTGSQVELRLTSGEKIAGKVKEVGAKSVHLTALTGQEFYDAVISLDNVIAIVLRAEGK